MSERQIVDVTEIALERVLELRAGEEDASELALRIEVVGVQGVDYSYDLAFEVLSHPLRRGHRSRMCRILWTRK